MAQPADAFEPGRRFARLRFAILATFVAAGLDCAEFIRVSIKLRAQRFDLVLAEVERGNYYAWSQALDWYPRLNKPEQQRLERMMVEYACRHQSISMRAAMRPGPRPHSPEWLIACQDIVSGLPWCRNRCCPAFYEWPVSSYFDPATGRPWVASQRAGLRRIHR